MNSVYVIYKDGERLTKEEAGRNVKIAYLKKGSANGVVSTLVDNFVRYELDLSEFRNKETFKEAYKKEKNRYEVIEYVRKQ